MKILDVVKLKVSYKDIPAETKGAIVYEYDGSCFEVEYIDSDGFTIDVLSTPADLLELIEEM